jgi:hypothetical protein
MSCGFPFTNPSVISNLGVYKFGVASGQRPSCWYPPSTVSLEDETTSCGSGKVILSLMEMFGILEATETDGVDGNVRHLRLAEGYEAKFLCVFGDGLTQIRVNGFKDKIETAAFSFEGRHKIYAMLHKALGQLCLMTYTVVGSTY